MAIKIETGPEHQEVPPKNPHVESSKVSNLLRGKVNGIHIGMCKGRWYVYEFRVGHLLWCRAFDEESEAWQCHRQRDSILSARAAPRTNRAVADSMVEINEESA